MFTLLLAGGLRRLAVLVLFIIFMPKGILGAAQEAWEKRYPVGVTSFQTVRGNRP